MLSINKLFNMSETGSNLSTDAKLVEKSQYVPIKLSRATDIAEIILHMYIRMSYELGKDDNVSIIYNRYVSPKKHTIYQQEARYSDRILKTFVPI